MQAEEGVGWFPQTSYITLAYRETLAELPKQGGWLGRKNNWKTMK